MNDKLGKALMASFNWPDADEIRLGSDFVPYALLFREGGEAEIYE